jgi:hypothetical protein
MADIQAPAKGRFVNKFAFYDSFSPELGSKQSVSMDFEQKKPGWLPYTQ